MVLNPGLGVLGRADGGRREEGSAPCPVQAGSLQDQALCCGLLPWEAGRGFQDRAHRDGWAGAG